MYRTRPIRFLEEWEHHGWRLKVYGISAWGDRPPTELIAEAKVVAGPTLPAEATADGRHGVGFVGVHDGKMASYVFVSWWAKLYELNHFLFRRTRGSTGAFEPVERGLFGCTWDLHVIAFERDAWIASLVDDAPDLARYLAQHLDTET